MARKKREGEYVCRCTAYRFPHHFGVGRCTGAWVVSEHWDIYWGHCEECQTCNNLVENNCQVMQGLEKETECQVFQEFVDYNEIRLLGGYWK